MKEQRHLWFRNNTNIICTKFVCNTFGKQLNTIQAQISPKINHILKKTFQRNKITVIMLCRSNLYSLCLNKSDTENRLFHPLTNE